MQNTAANKWIVGSHMAIGALCGLFVKFVTDTILTLADISVLVDSPLGLGDWLGLGVAMGLFILFRQHSELRQFSNDVFIELNKVTWPEWNETMISTGVITVMVTICALILMFFDVLWGAIINLV